MGHKPLGAVNFLNTGCISHTPGPSSLQRIYVPPSSERLMATPAPVP